MKTVLGKFCEEFDARVRPLLDPLDRFTDRLGALGDDAPLRALRPELLDLRHQLRTLVEKVADQQAYVIIFGPLKSGKSTLMNALAAAYVSEVTTLPAYPCMVYVAHATEPSLQLTRYDGSTEPSGDLAAMRRLMNEAHIDLAAAIRDVETRGEDFDPALHLPRALRRVDVRMPAEPLAESGAVLVDTPGLYSRMKFGYDLMTREFRDAAASAIFVVKTDNLFLEQVFEEFTDLLRLFSRIFLIVNLDGTKQDLQPDGALGPSLERSDPARIIEAFERLAMNVELKRAWEEGRLRIYPIDLLQAASRRLRDRVAAKGEGWRAAEEIGEAESSGAALGIDAFGRFTDDLTQYLNSTEYLSAFLHDSLRQARWLLGEMGETCESGPVTELSRSLELWTVERDRASVLREAARRLEEFSWEETLARLREDVVRITREQTTDLRREAAEQAEGALARWYDGDASYAALLHDELGPVFTSCRAAILERAADVSATVLASDMAGAMVRRDTGDDLSRVGLAVAAIARELRGTVHSATEARPVIPEIPARVIAVRRRWIDWLLLRSMTAVRRAVFGPDDAPGRAIPRAVKQHRLAAGRIALGEAIRARLEMFFAESLARSTGEVFGAHVAAVCREIHARLRAVMAENGERVKAADDQLASLRAIEESLDALRDALADASHSVSGLSETYGEVLPALPVAAVAEPVPIESAEPLELTPDHVLPEE